MPGRSGPTAGTVRCRMAISAHRNLHGATDAASEVRALRPPRLVALRVLGNRWGDRVGAGLAIALGVKLGWRDRRVLAGRDAQQVLLPGDPEFAALLRGDALGEFESFQ